MGNVIVFGERRQYTAFEGGIGGTLLGIVSIVVIIFSFIFCWKHREAIDKHYACRRNRQKSQESCCEKCRHLSKSCRGKCRHLSDACKKFFSSLDGLHDILGIIFSNVTQFFVERNGSTNAKKLLIISDRERPTGCIRYFAYTYYVYMALMSVLWFIATALEFGIYRKTTTCNDINVKVHSFRCYDVDNGFQVLDCHNTPNVDDKNVICYLYSPNIIAGLSVGFSAAKLISVVADVGYKMIFKITNKSHYCGATIRISLMLAAIVAVGIYLAVTLTKKLEQGYFLFGLVPMRVAQLILLYLTVAGMLLLPPWCQYPDEYYRTIYYYKGCGITQSNPNNGSGMAEFDAFISEQTQEPEVIVNIGNQSEQFTPWQTIPRRTRSTHYDILSPSELDSPTRMATSTCLGNMEQTCHWCNNKFYTRESARTLGPDICPKCMGKPRQ